MPKNTLMLACFICCLTAIPAQAQRRTRTIPPVNAQRQSDSWWAAQRNIESATANLEKYIRENPRGERASEARRQLESLMSLSQSARQSQWTRLDETYQRAEWRVVGVDAQEDQTRVTFEIQCVSSNKVTMGGETSNTCIFPAFDQNSLVLIDNTGTLNPMLSVGEMPSDLRPFNRPELGRGVLGVQMLLDRRITITVDFAPLSRTAVSGQIRYRESNTGMAQPARFTRVEKK